MSDIKCVTQMGVDWQMDITSALLMINREAELKGLTRRFNRDNWLMGWLLLIEGKFFRMTDLAYMHDMAVMRWCNALTHLSTPEIRETIAVLDMEVNSSGKYKTLHLSKLLNMYHHCLREHEVRRVASGGVKYLVNEREWFS